MNMLLGCLTLVLLGWLAAMLWAIYVAIVYTLALRRLRAASRRSADDARGEPCVADEWHHAGRRFRIAIAVLDHVHGLSRRRRHRVDAGAPSLKGGSGHAGA